MLRTFTKNIPSGRNAFLFLRDMRRLKLKTNTHLSIQYVSNLHVDLDVFKTKRTLPEVVGEDLAVVGNLGDPRHTSFGEFLQWATRNYRNVFLVPGPREHGCYIVYHADQANKMKLILSFVCANFNNLHLLDNRVCEVDDFVVAGSTFWSNPLVTHVNGVSTQSHHAVYETNSRWVQMIMEKYDKPLIMLTYHMPSYDMIDNERCFVRESTSLIASHDDGLIMSPVKAWICGNFYAKSISINGITCLATHCTSANNVLIA